MSEGDEMDSGAIGTTGTSTGPSPAPAANGQSQHATSMRKSSKDDTFASASDLSGVIENNRISSTNNSESNSNSTTTTTSSSSVNNSSSNTDDNSFSSSQSGQNQSQNGSVVVTNNKNSTPSKSSVSKQDSSSDTTEESCQPMFATCSSTSVSSATTVRRSESWSVLRSPSLDSSRNGSEVDNNEDTKSVASMNDPVVGESQTIDTYFTPSTSLHNIVLNKQDKKKSSSHPDGQLHSENNKSTDTDSKIAVNKDSATSNEKSDEDEVAGAGDEIKSPSVLPHIVVEEENYDEIMDDNKSPDHSEDASGTLMGDLTHSTESNTSKESTGGFGSGSKDIQIIKHHKPPGVRGKPTKKRMWYQQIFSASYKSRSGDFKKIFKELPSKERLLVDYSCALQKEILVQGRMYVSQGFLSFHANIFGWETQTSIKLKEITSITKEKTALVIPNAVQVMTDAGDKYFFTSFVTRDSTFLMLFKLWQNALLEDGMPSREIQQLVHSCYGEELVITTDDETEDNLSCKASALLVDTTDAATLLSVCDYAESRSIGIDSPVCSSDIGPALAVGGSLGTSIITSKTAGLIDNDLLHDPATGGISLPTDLSDTSDSEDDFQAAQGIILVDEPEAFEIPKCPVLHSEGKETINAIVPCNIDQLFTMLFTNSKFYLDFHTIRKTFDINQSPWGIGPDGNKKQRQVSFTVTLSAVMGPKHSQVTETQVMLPVSKPGIFYAIDSESVNAGIPYADTFVVTIHYCLSRVSANESRLVVVNQVKYKKSVWGITKSIIEKNCWAGIEEFYAHLERALKEECVKMSLAASPMASPKITAGSLSRRRPPKPRIKKGKAPGVPIGIPPVINQDGIRNGSIPGQKVGTTMSAVHEGSQTTKEGTFVLKVILSVLACLVLLNAFLYFKLTRLETSTTAPIMFPPHAFTFTGEIPQNHQDWLLLLQKQEALHRIELQKWHEILMSALKILNQAESDLEALKYHISTYNGAKYSVDMLKQSAVDNSISQTSTVVNSAEHNNYSAQSADSGDPLSQTIINEDSENTEKNHSQ